MTEMSFVNFSALHAEGSPLPSHLSQLPLVPYRNAHAARRHSSRPVSAPLALPSNRPMDLRKSMLVLAVAGSLVACGDNTDVQRGETNCDSAGQDAANTHDASCEETGTPAN